MKIRTYIYKLLKWSEKYTETDMVYLVKGGSWLVLGQFVTALAAFLLAVAFANLFSSATYGTYRYVLSVAGFLSITTLTGMNTAVVQSVARGFEGSLVQATKTRIYWGLIGSAGSLVLSVYYYLNANIVLAYSFFIVAFFIPFLETFTLYNAVLVGKKSFDKSSQFSIIAQIISVCCSVTMLFLTKNLYLILLAYFVPLLFVRCGFLLVVFYRSKLNQKKDNKLINYGKHLSLMNVLDAMAMSIDKVLIFHYLGSADLAVYLFAIAIPEQIKGVFKNVYTLALPKFANKTISEIKNNINRKMFKLAFAVSALVVTYILVAPLIYNVLFPKYIESIVYSQVFAISVIAVISALPSAALRAKAAKTQLYQINFFSALTRIILTVFGIYYYGLWGAVFAVVISRGIGIVIVLYFMSKLDLSEG